MGMLSQLTLASNWGNHSMSFIMNYYEYLQHTVLFVPEAPALLTKPSDCPHHLIGLPESPVKIADAVPFLAPGMTMQSHPKVVLPVKRRDN